MTATLKRANKKGFTLVELVIVIAILAILAAIAIPTVTNVITTANKNVDLANAQTIELTLKTADAEISGGTETASITESSTITAVLTAYGISLDPTATTKSNTHFAYKDHKVVLASDVSTATLFSKSDSSTTTLADFTGHTD